MNRVSVFSVLFFVSSIALAECPTPQNKYRSYNSEVREVFWGYLYYNGGGSLYCGDKFATSRNGFNIEHVVPRDGLK